VIIDRIVWRQRKMLTGRQTNGLPETSAAFVDIIHAMYTYVV